ATLWLLVFSCISPSSRDSGGDRVCHLVGGGTAAEVRGAELAVAEDAAHGGFDGVRRCCLAEVAEHEGACTNGCDGVGDTAPGDVRRAAVDGLEKRGRGAIW